MKYLFSVLLFLSAAACAVASTTTISASNITDLNGRKIAAAKLCFLPVDATGIAIGYRSGTAQIMPIKKCGQVSNGALQSGFTVFDSSSTVPTNMRYHITLTPAFNTVSVIRDFGTTTITGSTWTLDTFDPDATVLPALYTASSTSGSFYVNGDLTFTGTLVGTVPVSTLSSSVSTVNGVSCSLGGSCTVTASNPYALTMLDGYGSASSFSGSAAQTIHYLSTSQVSTQTVAGHVTFNGGAGSTGTYLTYYGAYASTADNAGTIPWIELNDLSNKAGAAYGDYQGQAQIWSGASGSWSKVATFSPTQNYLYSTTTIYGTTGEIVLGDAQAQVRMVYGNYGAFWRNDGTDLFLMLTASGDPYGLWNTLRPFDVNLSTGNVVLGENLTVVGSVTGASWSATSDRREKHNIRTLNPKSSLDRVMALRAVTFQWNDPKQDTQKQTGWIAQEVERAGMASSVSVKPGEIHHANGTTVKVDDFRSLKQNEMTAVLWAAVQEQQRQINQLRRQFKHKGAR
jgi:hypothetical protein